MPTAPTVVLEGPFFVHRGFAVVNRELALALVDRDDVDCWILPTGEPEFDPHADPRFRRLLGRIWPATGSRRPAAWIRHRFPPDFAAPPAPFVWYQPWEFGALPVEWVEGSRDAAEIWAPSRFVQRGMIQSGLDPARIHLVPYGVDTSVFRPDAPPMELATDKAFRFLFVGGAIPRKGIDLLLEAYARAFGPQDDVCLVVKDLGIHSYYSHVNRGRQIGSFQTDPAKPALLYLPGELGPAAMPGLYTACHCLVYPSRGEGFGLAVPEAMACGLPVIVPDSGAPSELVTAETGYLVPSTLQVLRERWVEPYVTAGLPVLVQTPVEELAAAMRQAYEDREDARRRGLAALQRARARYTWARAAERVASRLAELEGSVAPAGSLQQALAEGVARYQAADLDAAARVFRAVLCRWPGDPDARHNLAAALAGQGEAEQAAAEYLRLAEQEPAAAAASAAALAGNALVRVGDLHSAILAYRLALAADPGLEVARENLAVATEMAAGQPDVWAGGWYRQALERLTRTAPDPAPAPAGAETRPGPPPARQVPRPARPEAAAAAVPGQPLPVIWRGDLYGLTGYGDETRSWVRCLLSDGRFRVRLETAGAGHRAELVLEPEEIEAVRAAQATELDDATAVLVWHYPPPQVRPERRARVRVCRTMFETDSLPRTWVSVCNRMDEVWVPTAFNLKSFEAAGVRPDRLRVLPMGIDADRFRPDAEPMRLPGRRGFAFLSNFDWGQRKGWDVLLRAYAGAFGPRDDVTLVLKLSQTQGQRQELIERRVMDFVMRELGLDPDQMPDVLLLSGDIPAHRMPSLYTACDAFVLASRGEGWGRPYLEAMACGLPTIGTRWSGNLAFMTDDNSYLIDVEGLEPVPAGVDSAVYRGHRWARPSVEHLVVLLRRVYEHRVEARARARQARADAVARWHWPVVARELHRELLKFT